MIFHPVITKWLETDEGLYAFSGVFYVHRHFPFGERGDGFLQLETSVRLLFDVNSAIGKILIKGQ